MLFWGRGDCSLEKGRGLRRGPFGAMLTGANGLVSGQQTLIYGPVMCIRHHNVAQTCALCISKAIDAVHPYLELCIMHQ